MRRAEASDAEALNDAFINSARELAPWSFPPLNIDAYIAGQQVYLLCEKINRDPLAVFSLSGIVRGFFHSAYLGYNAFTPYQGKGYMRAGMQLLIAEAFNELKLHRLEANIQPGNLRSIKLVAGAGFNKEGYSPQYLRINGEWKDHERWAIVNKNWLE